jgi:hypothetical protein
MSISRKINGSENEINWVRALQDISAFYRAEATSDTSLTGLPVLLLNGLHFRSRNHEAKAGPHRE